MCGHVSQVRTAFATAFYTSCWTSTLLRLGPRRSIISLGMPLYHVPIPLEANALLYNSSISLFSPPTPSSTKLLNLSRKLIASLKDTARSSSATMPPSSVGIQLSVGGHSCCCCRWCCSCGETWSLLMATVRSLPEPLWMIQLTANSDSTVGSLHLNGPT